MGLFREILRYGLVYHAAKNGTQKAIERQARKLAKRQGSVPFETTIKLRVPVDDDVSPEDLSAILSGVEIDVPPGVSIDTIDISAALVGDTELKKHSTDYGCQSAPPPRLFETVGMSRSAKRHYRNVERQKRAEDKKRQEEDLRQTMQSLDEMDAFLKNHTPEEYEQWLLERSQQ